MKKIILCSWCINGIRSHGENVFVGDTIDYDDTKAKCEWCDDDESELYECVFEDGD